MICAILRPYFCLFLLACTNLLIAQPTLSGTITDDQNGEALIGANIFLSSDFSIGSQTDIDGKFSFSVPAEKGTLIISYIGYEDLIVEFKSTIPLAIKMIPKATTIETVVVKGNKLTGQVFVVEKINKLDIYLNPSSKADALRAVQSNVASTTVDETANVSLRGSPASETGIFLNNVPLNDVVRLDQANGVGQFSIFNTSTLESVNIFASNPPLEFGNATSGVVAIYTEDELPETANSISLNLVGIGLSTSRKIGNKTAISVFGNWNTPYFLKGVNPKSLKDLTTFNTIETNIYGVHQFNANWQLKFFNYAINERFRYQVRFPSFEDAFKQQKKRNLSIINLIQQKEKTRFEWNQGINFSDANYQVGNSDINTQKFDYFSGLNYAWYPKNGSVKIGLNTNIHRLGSDGLTPLYEYGISSEHPTIPFANKEWIIIPEGFAYTKWTFKENLSLGLGGRFHPKFDDLDSYASYQLNLAYTFQEKHRLIASFGEYHKFQLPNAESNEIQKLFSRQYSIDYHLNINKWKWSTAVYQKDNLRADSPNLVRGAEIYTAYQGQDLNWGISVASIQSTMKNGDTDYPTDHDLSYFLRTTLQYTIAGTWEVGLVYWQRQGRYYLPVSQSYFDEQANTFTPIYVAEQEGLRLPDYRRMDISISRKMGLPFGSAVVYANANNLFNSKNVRDYNYNEDYSQRFAEYLNRRVVFFGLVLNWE